MCVYNSFTFNFKFLKKFQNIVEQLLEHYIIIILWDFNVYILKNNNHAKNKKELLDFMDKFELNS